MPEATGVGRVLVIGALAIIFALGLASMVAAVVGDRWGGPMYMRRRGVSFVVGLTYLVTGFVVLIAAHNQLLR